MKEFIELVKKLWSNKRYRAIAILLIYVVFFIFVFSFISSGKPNLPLEVGIDKIKNIENYKLYFEGIDSFNVDYETNTIYYGDSIYSIEEDIKELNKYDLNIFKPINIYNLIKKGTLESTNYVSKEDTYMVKISDFEQLIYNNDVSNDNYIKIIVNNEFYNKIVVDLTNYYGYSVRIEG